MKRGFLAQDFAPFAIFSDGEASSGMPGDADMRARGKQCIARFLNYLHIDKNHSR